MWNLFCKAVALLWNSFWEAGVVIRHARNLKTRIFTRRLVLDQDAYRVVGAWGSRALSRAGRHGG